MSNLSNEMPFPKEPVDEENPTSFRVMLFTILLLIAGLLMTGTMMLYYANAQRSELAETAPNTDETSRTASSISAFFEKMSSESNEAHAGATNSNSGVINQLFGGRGGSSANWPKLKLTGFGSATDGSGGFAIINNHQYRKGDLINGKATLIEIRTHDVLMEYMGETNTLSLKISN